MHTLEQQCQNETLKRIKIDRIIEEEEDRISLFLDCLLIEILSRLPTTKEVIKTGILSKRWRHLWPLVHNLIFLDGLLSNERLIDFYKLVDKTLAQCRHLKLNKFKLNAYFLNQFEPLVKYWIRGAINLNVNELDLSLCNYISMRPIYRFEPQVKDVLVFDSELFFINSNFIHLKLACSEFNPTGAISWKNLKSLCISCGKLDEGLIQNMLSGSPLLETFKLEDCYGFRQINITSKSVKHLAFNGSLNPPEHQLEGGEEIIDINAPNILTLTIPRLLLWKLVLLNVSSLVEANLKYYSKEYLYHHTPNEDEQERLKELLLSLRHVKEVKLGFFCSKVLFDLEAKGFSCQSNVKCRDKHFVNERVLKMKRLNRNFQKNDTKA